MASASLFKAAALSKATALFKFVALALLFGFAAGASADTTYLAPDDFLHQVFHDTPKPAFFWLDKSAQAQLTRTLGHPYPQARLRYWRADGKSAWILDEIGKEYPITAGFVVADKKIQRAQVLIYRETRGMEIHLPAFLAQFIGAGLTNDSLSNHVDGITGATLSVDAMKRMASAALALDALASAQQP